MQRAASILERDPWRRAALLVPVAFLLGVAVHVGVLQQFPNSADEYAYLWQAEAFAQGRVTAATPPPRDTFAFFHLGDVDGRRFSRFPPGWPLLLTPGVWLELPGLINPLLAALALAGIYRLGCAWVGPRPALLGTLLTGLSPFFLLNAGSFHSHPSSLFALTGLALSLSWALERPGLIPLALAGASFGLAVSIRPYTALLLGGPLLIAHTVGMLRDPAARSPRLDPAADSPARLDPAAAFSPRDPAADSPARLDPAADSPARLESVAACSPRDPAAGSPARLESVAACSPRDPAADSPARLDSAAASPARLRPVAALFAFGAGALPFALVFGAVNQAITGDWSKLATTFIDPEEGLGFGVHGHTLQQGLQTTLLWFLEGLAYTFFLSPLLLVAAKGHTGSRGRLLWVLLLAPVIGYLFYWNPGGNRYGPRFYFEALLPFTLLTGVGLARVIDAGRYRPLIAGAGLMGLAVLGKLSIDAHRQVEARSAVYRTVEAAGLDRAVVLLLSGSADMAVWDLTRNPPAFEQAPVLYGRGRGAADQEVEPHHPDRKIYYYRWNEAGGKVWPHEPGRVELPDALPDR